MKKTKKLLTFCLSAVLVFSIGVNGINTIAVGEYDQKQVDLFKDIGKTKISDFLYESEKRAYDIVDISFIDGEVINKDGKLQFETNVRVKEVLKAKEIEEMPYVKGYLKGLGVESYKTLSASEKKNVAIKNLGEDINLTSSAKADKLVKTIDDRFSDLESYIGKVSDFGFSFLVSIDIADLNDITKETVDLAAIGSMGEEVSVDEFKLRSEEEIYQSGLNDAISTISNTINWIADPIDNWSNYNRIAARDYAYKYYYNYNPEYTSYKGIGGDCANFVSQCIKNGGVPTNTSGGYYDGWYKDSLPWISASNLVNYMMNNGYATYESYTNTTAGNFAHTKYDKGHVVLVTINDGTRIAYTAHTDDVIDQTFLDENLNSSLPFNSSSKRYKFYVIKNY